MGNSCIRIFAFLLLLHASCALGQSQIKLDSLQLQLASVTEDTLKATTLLQISDFYLTSNYIKAIEYAKQAKELAKKAGFKKLEAKSENRIANIFTAMGDYKNASIHYFSSLKFYEQEKDTIGILGMHNNLGVVYDRLKEFDKALAHYFIARDLFNHLKSGQEQILAMPSLYNNIANIYQTKSDFKSALQYYDKALSMAIENKNKSVQGIALNNLGKLYLVDLKQPEKALDYLLRGLTVREEYGDKGEIAKSLIILSDYHLRQRDLSQGNQYAERALRLGREIGSVSVQQDAYEYLSKLNEALGDYTTSLLAFKQFKIFSDSIHHQLASSEITSLQLQYDFEKTEEQRAEEVNQSRNRYIIIIIALSASLLVVILITTVIRSRASQTELKRKNLAQDVEIKNKELTTNVMYLIRKNELINNVAERLLTVQANVQPENHKVVHDIILDLQKEADNDSWKEFELRFNQVHSDFYNNLRKLYPGLSPADEKLCAFLRLNMSSKEIAAITQQSIKSVEVARARLRKKLNLTNTTSNLVTHLSNL